MMRCPTCGSESIRRSLRRGIVEGIFLRLAFRAPFRCFQCGARFTGPSHLYQFRQRKRHRSILGFFGLRGSARERIRRRLITVILAAILIILAILLVLRLSEPGPQAGP